MNCELFCKYAPNVRREGRILRRQLGQLKDNGLLTTLFKTTFYWPMSENRRLRSPFPKDCCLKKKLSPHNCPQVVLVVVK